MEKIEKEKKDYSLLTLWFCIGLPIILIGTISLISLNRLITEYYNTTIATTITILGFIIIFCIIYYLKNNIK